MVECWLPYGYTEVHVSIPLRDLAGVVEPKIGEVIRDVETAVREAAENPINCEALSEMAEASSISIGVDGSLPTETAISALSGLLGIIGERCRLEDVSIIIGFGLRTRGVQRLLKQFRESLPRGVEIRGHTAQSETEELGKTRRGTTVKVSKPLQEGEVRILVGEFHPDPLAGFKGPHTAILPQLSGFETIEDDRRLHHQGSTGLGVVDGNPILRDSWEALRLTGVDASLLLVTDHRGGVIDILYGEAEALWSEALAEYRDLYSVDVEPADVYILSPGGGRFDFDLYHSLWALKALGKPERGSRIILVAECGEGLGAEGLLKLAGVEKLGELKRRYMLGGDVLHLLRSLQRAADILLVSTLPTHLAEPLGLEVYRAVNDAFEAAGRGRVLILPYALSITPRWE